jgi:hypothetical protein
MQNSGSCKKEGDAVSADLEQAQKYIEQGDFKRGLRKLEDVCWDFRTTLDDLDRVEVLAKQVEGESDGKLATKARDVLGRVERARRSAAEAADYDRGQQAAYEARAQAEAKKRFKVLTQKDRFFAGKFDPEKLEAAINSYADEGWDSIAMATASIHGIGGNRDEMIVLMKRREE